MESFKFGWSILIAVCILLGSHLSVDRDFPEKLKNGAIFTMVVLMIAYIIFVVF